MKNTYMLIKTTIMGGLVFLVPVVIVAAILGKAYHLMTLVAKPIEKAIPIDAIGGIAILNIIAVIIILLCCLIAGFIARSGLGKKALAAIENILYKSVPGYPFIKGLTEDLASSDHAAKGFTPVLVSFDDNAQIAFEVERTGKGTVVVFLPGAPNPWSGSVAYLSEDRIKKLNLSVSDAINNIKQLGRGSAEYSNSEKADR